ncbi:ABC transporter [Actinomyces radicidentis]|uniref:ABC transporter n=1 Tax=Actinomyces radicidentis TaxID=111015 RepID=A0A109W3D0_ACTRD|nr:ABC transporter [Actinomyces radicidentis]
MWDEPGPRAAVALLGTRRCLLENNRLTDSIALWRTTRPLWSSRDLARYLELFEVDVDCVPRRLSQGQRSAVDAAFALASHSPVLLLDEVHLGMDAVVRRRFWDALLAQYAAEQGTVVIAAHEVEEIANLVEDVVILTGGTVGAAGSADDLRAACTPPGAPLADLTDVLEHYSAKGA